MSSLAKTLKSKIQIDWMLLIFLMCSMNVKLYIKVAGICVYLVYALFIKKYKRNFSPSGFLIFYISISLLGIISSISGGSVLADGYPMLLGVGILHWGAAAAICFLLQLTISNSSGEVLYKTIQLFFIVNFIWSLTELGLIISTIHSFPYWIKHNDLVYGISTGDHIMGLFRSTSITNAALTAIGAVYFLYNRNLVMAMICMLTCSLATSNAILLVFLLVAIMAIILGPGKNVRISSLITVLLTIVFYFVISPDNVSYIAKLTGDYNNQPIATTTVDTVKVNNTVNVSSKNNNGIEKSNEKTTSLDSLMGKVLSGQGPGVLAGEKYGDVAIKARCFSDIKAILSGMELMKINDIHERQKELPSILFLDNCFDKPLDSSELVTYKYPLKLYTFEETLHYLGRDVRTFFLGAGIANFSSKLAVKATGLGLQGSYPDDRIYASRPFLENHLYEILYLYSLPASKHSIVNTPNSVYNQIAGEYGVIGVLLLLFFYFGYAIKRSKGRPLGYLLVSMVVILFGVEYWFEMMSITVLFELLIMSEIKNVHVES